MYLNEKAIKTKLIDYILDKKYPKCKLIGVEVPFISMKRRVDVLVITGQKELIAFEIKSDLDSLYRLNDQIKDYKKAFDKLYIVTSEKYKNIRLPSNLCKNLGFIYINGQVCEKKKAVKIRELDKNYLIRFLLKKDLIKLGYSPRESIVMIRENYLRQDIPNSATRTLAIESLLDRYSYRFQLFKKYKESKTTRSDLDYLTKDFCLEL